jgi:acetyltransferase-like isoleucine patch superfamily enzyme
LRVGEWSSIGPGTVVIRSVEPRQHVFGNPARVVAPVASAAMSQVRHAHS